ncbi:MAG TPA: glycosyltransferase, partial [Solirubrobacterales bacterium]|nr:glycosyltransferase [Solirubrobacterales bacterium]
MTEAGTSGGPAEEAVAGGRAVLVVRNTASHDARVLRCAKTLRSLGYEPLVLAVTSEDETATRATIDGIAIRRLTPRVPLPRLRRGALKPSLTTRPPSPSEDVPRMRPGLLARFYRLLRTLDYYRRGIAAVLVLRPRLVHCNDYNTMWIGVAAKLLTGCALVYDSHELWPDRNGRSEPRWWLLACEALFLRLADAALATSPGHADTIARRHRVAPPLVVRNVAERMANAGGAESVVVNGGGREGGATIAYVGAVTSHRGLEQAIAALPQAEGVALRIVGPGSTRQQTALSELAAQ